MLDNIYVLGLICSLLAMFLTFLNYKASKEEVSKRGIIKNGLLGFILSLLTSFILKRNDLSSGSVEQDILTGSPDF
jgi:hypothetical protein